MPFMRMKSRAIKNCDFTALQENKSPANVHGTQADKIMIYVRKGEKMSIGEREEREEATS